MADARPQAIAKQVADKPGLSIDQLHGTFMAVRNANTTSVAFLFINLNNLSFHIL
jgi:hypothetical protein